MAQEKNIIETTKLSAGQVQEANICGSQSAKRERGQAVVVVPTTKESLQMGLLENNLAQAEDYMNQFSNEKDTLGATYNECEDIIGGEFEKLRDLLRQREDILLKELKMRFEERDNKIFKQINELENHCNNNLNNEDECKELLRTMQNREEKAERTLKITKLCQDCINQSPVLKEVPIDLKHKFVTEKKLINLINNYGELVCKRIESGCRRKFKTFIHNIISHPEFVGEKVNYNGNNNNNNNNNNDNNKAAPNGLNINGSLNVDNNIKEVVQKEEEDEPELEMKEKDVIITLPEKVRISCNLVVNGDSKKKLITLKKDKNEFTLTKIKDKLEKANNVKKIITQFGNDKVRFNYCLIKNGENVADIENDDDFIKHVILGADPNAKVAVCINAELVILD